MKNLKSTFKFVSVMLILISAFGIISSCSDDGDEEAPVINLESPLAHTYFILGEEIHFHGDVTDNEEVESIAISMWDEDDSANLLFHMHLHPGTASFHIDTSFTVTTYDSTEYVLKVVAEDAAGNTSETLPDYHLHINM